jgi:cell division protein FtsW
MSSRNHTDKINKIDKNERPMDFWLFFITVVLLAFGLVMVYESSYPLAQSKGLSGQHFLLQQLRGVGIGIAGLFVFSRIHYKKLAPFAWVGIIIAFLALIAVEIMGIGKNGGTRWLKLGPLVCQPSEFIKPLIALFMAYFLASRPKLAQNPFQVIFFTLFLSIPIVLVEHQPDLGTAIVLGVMVLALLFMAGTKKRLIFSFVGLGALAAVALTIGPSIKNHTDPMQNFRVQRILHQRDLETYKGTKEAYQPRHSLYALGTGGYIGAGLGQSRQKLVGFLPERHTDCIYAIVGEEFGLVGTIGVLLGYLFFAARGVTIAAETRDRFGALLAMGLTISIVGQALINMAVVTVLIPTTGVTLPLISFGSSSLVTILWTIGILLSISRFPGEARELPKKKESSKNTHG